jgi:dihydrofolate reductase
MGSVVLDLSTSLDGFIAAANARPEQPLGEGGTRLHDWVFKSEDPRDREILKRGADLGAVIAGRRTYDTSLPWWGADGPTGAARLPVFVVSHSVDVDAPEGGVYIFAEGIETALAWAKAAADGKDVSVMGGADLARQFLAAGLVDEIQIHLVPVLFGGGTRLFEGLGCEPIALETAGVIATAAATHLRYRVVR